MRQFGRVVAMALMAWLMVGCGGLVTPIAGGTASGLVLADAGSGTHYELSVADGSLTLTGIGSAGTAANDARLNDSATGASYQVGVTSGALTLEPGGSAGVEEIPLTDAVTAKTYELAVASGALTLVPSAGGGR